jgi:hypothetical protein
LVLEVQDGDAPAAGGLDAGDLGEDDLAHAGEFGEMFCEIGPIGIVGGDGSSGSIETEDFGGFFEGAEHESDSGIFQKMGGGFVAAAGEVEVGDLCGREDSKSSRQALGGDVDVAIGRERGGGDEEEGLGFDEGLQFGGDFGVEVGHWGRLRLGEIVLWQLVEEILGGGARGIKVNWDVRGFTPTPRCAR